MHKPERHQPCCPVDLFELKVAAVAEQFAAVAEQ